MRVLDIFFAAQLVLGAADSNLPHPLMMNYFRVHLPNTVHSPNAQPHLALLANDFVLSQTERNSPIIILFFLNDATQNREIFFSCASSMPQYFVRLRFCFCFVIFPFLVGGDFTFLADLALSSFAFLALVLAERSTFSVCS